MIKSLPWEEILPIWQHKLWPDRKSAIESNSAMKLSGGYDIENMKTVPTFVGYFIDDNLVGVFSGHKCSENDYRVRGFWVEPKYRKQGIGTELLQSLINQGKKEGCSIVWGYPKSTSWNIFKRLGFKLASDWEPSETSKENAYCILELNEQNKQR